MQLKMLKNVNKIYVMKSGEIVQQGSFPELLKCENGFFRTLWDEQEIRFS